MFTIELIQKNNSKSYMRDVYEREKSKVSNLVHVYKFVTQEWYNMFTIWMRWKNNYPNTLLVMEDKFVKVK